MFVCLCRSARALYDCNAEDVLELSFQKDEILYNGTCVSKREIVCVSKREIVCVSKRQIVCV